MRLFFCILVSLGASSVFGLEKSYLLKIDNEHNLRSIKSRSDIKYVKPLLLKNWHKVIAEKDAIESFKEARNGIKVTENLEVRAIVDFENKKEDVLYDSLVKNGRTDPEFGEQWGMYDIELEDAWYETKGDPDVIVAVIDSGVDYEHEDLKHAIWKNEGELGIDREGNPKSSNGIDDDGNGFVDDHRGWDFAGEDNDPMDKVGGNWFFPGSGGHGTHCAGNVAADAYNDIGIMGVAPDVTIMPIRFLNSSGGGDLGDAVDSIVYAVDNGAQVLTNSWGVMKAKTSSDIVAISEAVDYAEENGVLFVAAAGNGRYGKGFNNDKDSRPAYPASLEQSNVLSVAALSENDKLTRFSNWGLESVDIGAPGADITSTFPKNKYKSMSGTSMACPIVAGAAALYWSNNPDADYETVKQAILDSSVELPSLKDKVLSGGKLNVSNLMAE